MSGVGNPKGVGGFIRGLIPEGFYSRTQAAALMNVHYQTLIRWENDGKIVPDAYMETGKQTMPLFTMSTINQHKKEA